MLVRKIMLFFEVAFKNIQRDTKYLIGTHYPFQLADIFSVDIAIIVLAFVIRRFSGYFFIIPARPQDEVFKKRNVLSVLFF